MNVGRTILIAAILGLICLGFFGVVTFQNTEAVSTVRQQAILQTLSSVLIRDAEGADPGVWETSGWLDSQPLLNSPQFSALVLNGDGEIVNSSHFDARAGHPAPVQAFLSVSSPHLQSVSVHGCHYVWTVTALPGTENALVLIHASGDDTTAQLVQLYLVPTIIAVLVIFWVLVWVRLSLVSRIRIIARQKHLEAELLQEQEAGRVKSAFLANMSHELRTPLNAIIGFAQMLRNETFGPLGSARNSEYVQIIHDAGTHLSRLVGHVLDLSQVEAGSTDLHESENPPVDLFDECRTLVRSQVESRDQAISVSIDPGIGVIFCDRLRMVQVLLNLLSNASKFSPRNSTIRLEANRQANGDLLLQVIDQGRGIAAEEIANVLKPFGQAEVNAETARDGTGLGLPLSVALMELHGGALTINSVPGEGTTVTARLPASRHRPVDSDDVTSLPIARAANQ